MLNSWILWVPSNWRYPNFRQYTNFYLASLFYVWQWTSTLGGLCAYETRACDFRESTSQDNWFFSQYISYLQAREVFVNVSAGFTECRLSPPCNRLYVDVYRYERNGRSDAAARTTSNYQLTQRIQQPNGFAQRTYQKSFTFIPSGNFNGFYIGIRDTGTCVNIQRIQVYYRTFQPTAPVDPDPAVICPRTSLPPAGTTASVTCSCPGNSVATSSLQLTCHPDGTCTGNPRCRCHDGYQKLPQECRGTLSTSEFIATTTPNTGQLVSYKNKNQDVGIADQRKA